MASTDVKLDLTELENYQKDMLKIAHEIDNGKYVKTFLRNTGNKAKRRVLSQAKSDVKNSITGNLFKGQKRGRVYWHRQTQSFAVRVFGGAPAYHTNLLEYGHRIILPNGAYWGYWEGYGFFQKGMEKYEPLFYEDLEYHVVDKVIERLT